MENIKSNRIILKITISSEMQTHGTMDYKIIWQIDARKRLEVYYSDSMKALQANSLRDVFHGVVMESIDEMLQVEYC